MAWDRERTARHIQAVITCTNMWIGVVYVRNSVHEFYTVLTLKIWVSWALVSPRVCKTPALAVVIRFYPDPQCTTIPQIALLAALGLHRHTSLRDATGEGTT